MTRRVAGAPGNRSRLSFCSCLPFLGVGSGESYVWVDDFHTIEISPMYICVRCGALMSSHGKTR
jgi:hypothetical protein